MSAKDLAFYETILDLFPGMISVVSPDFVVLYANNRLRERCKEDPVGKNCYEVYHGLKRPCPWCKKDEVLETKQILIWTVQSPRDNHWYEVRSIPFYFQDRWTYLSVIIDITEKKELEGKLENQLRFFQEILERNPALVLFNREGKLVFVNRTFEEITGIPRKEALGKDIFQLFVPETDKEAWNKHCEEVNRGIFHKGVELPVVNRKGEKRYLLWNCMQVKDPEGQPIIVGFAIDITKQKELFEQYLQAQKMESLGRFTGVLLHELNNLFMALQGYLGVAKITLSEPEKVKDYLEKMEGLIERWRHMSQDLLSFVRRSPGALQTINVAEFLRQQRDTLSRLLGSKIELEIQFPSKELYVEMNPVHLQQILFNLVSNAHEAMPEGGRVRISLEEVILPEDTAKILGLSTKPFLLLSFEDNGPGISEEVLPHIFEPYFTTKESGTGLGLATVYSLVKQYQGHIAVYSSLGKGTIFRIYLPAKETFENKSFRPSFYHILIVEEEKFLLETIKEMMEYLGYRPFMAAGIKDAEEIVSQGFKPEALLMDIKMKSGDTIQFIEDLKTRFPDLKVIIVSGYGKEIVRETLPFEDFFYLSKPFSIEELSAVLTEALAGE